MIPFNQHSNRTSQECSCLFSTPSVKPGTDGLLKCWLPRATKEFTKSCMYKSIPTNSPAQSHSHAPNWYSRFVQPTCIETACGLMSPSPFLIPATLSSTFPSTFKSHTLFSTQTSNTSSGPPKKKINLQSLHSTRLLSFHQETRHRGDL